MRLPVRVRAHTELILARFCRERVPSAMSGQVRLEYEIHGHQVILVERRPPWQSQTPDEEWLRTPVARFRFVNDPAGWTLDWPDRDDKWHRYQFTSAKTLAGLLREVDRDPTGIFWG
jgi:Protein of unknown function (DUF3024)